MNEKSRSWLDRLANLLGNEAQNKEELMVLLRSAARRDILSGEVLGMIERILHVSDMQVREVMVPKARMVCIEEHNDLKTILPFVIESGHSRFPVVSKKEAIVGIVLAKDLLKYMQQPATFKLENIMRKALFTAQSKRLDILLREFRVNRNHLAIVLDEYSQVAGLVTIEDVLEQIVGEIEDEYDIDEENGFIKKIEEDVFIVKATTPIEEFNVYFHSRFTDEEFDTIGGIVLKKFGHLPKRGENITIRQFRFKVLQCDNRRLYLLEVKKIKKKKIHPS